MVRHVVFPVCLCLALLPVSLSAQGVNYHAAQQAGKVWGDKIGENNRKTAAEQARDRRPVTAAERKAALARYRERYDKLVDSVGTKNADRFLDFWARRDRRSPPLQTAAPSAKPAGAPKAALCSHDARPPAERKRLEAEFAGRVKRDGLESAGAWAREQGRLFRKRQEAQGIC